jgi:hypothetical protein
MGHCAYCDGEGAVRVGPLCVEECDRCQGSGRICNNCGDSIGTEEPSGEFCSLCLCLGCSRAAWVVDENGDEGHRLCEACEDAREEEPEEKERRLRKAREEFDAVLADYRRDEAKDRRAEARALIEDRCVPSGRPEDCRCLEGGER